MATTKIVTLYLLTSLCLWSSAQSGSYPKAELFERMRTEKIQSDQTVKWTNFGPGMSGYCEEMWCHPTDTNVMFLGPDMHVSFGSWDNGKSWQTIKDSDGDGQCLERVLDIAFSKNNPDFGVALERRGKVFVTNNCGRNWELIYRIGTNDGAISGAHTKIAIHPNNDNIWLIGAGNFWNVKSNHRSKENPYGPKSGKGSRGYILKTTDGGKSWTKIATGISDDLDVGRIIYNPNNPDVIIIATSHGVFKSTDGGDSWVPSAAGLPNNQPRDMVSYYNDKTKEFVLYLVEQTMFEPDGKSVKTKGGVFKSEDEGATWTSITGDLSVDFTRITDREHLGNFHRAVSFWLGEDSKKLYPQFPTHTFPVFNRLVVNPTNKDELYLVENQRHDQSFGPGDAWTTKDGGRTWKICAREGQYWLNETDKAYWVEKGNEIGTNVKFAHLQSYVDSNHEMRNGNRMLAINAKGEAFIGINQQTLKTTNGGKTWEQVDDFETAPGSGAWIGRGGSDLPGRFMLLETGVRGRYLFCAGEHGLWQTADLGNWPDKQAVAVKQIEGQSFDTKENQAAHSIGTVAVHPQNPDIIYMLPWRQEHMGEVRRSMNGGKTWENIATIFERKPGRHYPEDPVAYQNSLLFDYRNPNNMYFCATRHSVQEIHPSIPEDAFSKGVYGIYKSTDMGFTWSEINSGLPEDCSVRRLTMDPKNPLIIYASLNQRGQTTPGGLYKTTNGGLNWEKVATLSPEVLSVNNFCIDRKTGYMYVSSGSSAGSYEGGGVWRSTDEGKTWEKWFEAPYVWQTEVSPANSDIIMVNVPLYSKRKNESAVNPGIYLTQDGGKSWAKINRGLGQPDKITDIKPDPYNENVIWCASWGCGWFVAYLNAYEGGWLQK